MSSNPETLPKQTKKVQIEMALCEYLAVKIDVPNFSHLARALTSLEPSSKVSSAYVTQVYAAMRQSNPDLPETTIGKRRALIMHANIDHGTIYPPASPDKSENVIFTYDPSHNYKPESTKMKFLAIINELQPQRGGRINLADIAKNLGVSRQRVKIIYDELQARYPVLPITNVNAISRSFDTLKPNEQQVLTLWENGDSGKEIAEKTGQSVFSVYNHIRHLREIRLIPENTHLKDNPHYVEVAKLRSQGIGETQIAKQLGIDLSLVNSICNSLRKDGLAPRLRNKRPHVDTLSDKQRVTDLANKGFSRAEIAKTLKIPLGTLDPIMFQLIQEGSVARKYSPPRSPEEIEQLNQRVKELKLADPQKTHQSIAQELGFPTWQISRSIFYLKHTGEIPI